MTLYDLSGTKEHPSGTVYSSYNFDRFFQCRPSGLDETTPHHPGRLVPWDHYDLPNLPSSRTRDCRQLHPVSIFTDLGPPKTFVNTI